MALPGKKSGRAASAWLRGKFGLLGAERPNICRNLMAENGAGKQMYSGGEAGEEKKKQHLRRLWCIALRITRKSQKCNFFQSSHPQPAPFCTCTGWKLNVPARRSFSPLIQGKYKNCFETQNISGIWNDVKFSLSIFYYRWYWLLCH